jgi:CheY-like chemotaxis protein
MADTVLKNDGTVMAKARILIVEDSMIVSTHIRALLSEEGYEVLAVLTTGEESIRYSQQNHPDLILMDIILAGEINGIEAAEQIRSSCESPVIFLTAMTDKSTLDKAKRTGPYSYIVKPFDELDLLTRIELALYKSKLEKESQRQRLETLIEGQEMERARISRDLHDGIGQLLNAVKLNVDAIGVDSLGKAGDKIMRLINESVSEVRRIAENLLPARLQNADLISCLSNLCTTNETESIRIQFQTDAVWRDVSDQHKTMIYHLCSALLSR